MNLRHAVVLILTVGVFTVLVMSAAADPAKQTENVIVVVIDGLRNEEAFDDPDHAYIPHIWNDLRPQGTIYTEFYNDHMATYTTAAHEAIVTGQWHLHPNLLFAGFNDIRPEAPTMFECFRRFTSAPMESCLIVTGKTNNMRLDWSLDPVFGPEYAPLLFEGKGDDETFALLAEKLAEYRPKLVLVNFRDVDEFAHTNVWEDYTAAIKTADKLVYRLWTDLIQNDEQYKNKTTMIVTSDHGRHDDTVGFEDHGGMSHQNRHVLFLAIGPDTPRDLSISERRYLIDIAATAGELLGFPTPFAHGQVIAGVFREHLNPDHRIRVARKNPRGAAYDGGLAVVWSENVPEDMGNERVTVMIKKPGDEGFGEPVLVSDPGVARWAFYPDVAINADGAHVVWLDGRPLDGIRDTWSIYHRRSVDWGDTWEPEMMIATSTFESAEPGKLEVVGQPEIVATENGEVVISVNYRGAVANKKLVSYRSGDGGVSWAHPDVTDGGVFPLHWDVAAMPGAGAGAVAWIDLVYNEGSTVYKNYEVFCKTTKDAGLTWENLRRLSFDPGYSFNPAIAADPDRLVVVWADRPADGSLWVLNARATTNLGESWSEVKTIPAEYSPWRPSLIWSRPREEFVLVWADADLGHSDIYFSTSPNGRDWAAPARLPGSTQDVVRCNPQAVGPAGGEFIIWEELDGTSGDRSIRAAQISDAPDSFFEMIGYQKDKQSGKQPQQRLRSK